MNQNRELLLVFSQDEFLGELRLEDGRFKDVMLSTKGEERLGGALHGWLIEGLPRMREITIRDAEKEERIWGMERIPPRDPDFGMTLKEYLTQTEGMDLIGLDDVLAKVWERLLELPLSAEERSKFIHEAAALDLDQAQAWLVALDEAAVEVHKV